MTGESGGSEPDAGALSDAIVRIDIALTAVFVVTAAYAATVFDTPAQWIGAVTAMVLFAVGVATFLWGFWNAVQRSRTEEIAVTQVFLLLGTPTPAPVRRAMTLRFGFGERGHWATITRCT